MIYCAGQVVGDREVLGRSHSLGKIVYYSVRCLNCGHKSLMSGTSLYKITRKGVKCKRCYHTGSKQAFGNYRTINAGNATR